MSPRNSRERMLPSTMTLLASTARTRPASTGCSLTAEPRGSVYHHFPGGRAQLIDEAGALVGDLMTRVIDAAMHLELKANYIRAAHTNGQTFTATGTVIHSGRRTATAEGKGAGRTRQALACSDC
jgi:uncharacterized protein (TIGR00369 family)